MTSFEVSVNGYRRFVGDDVRAITVVSDWISRRQTDRVSVHVGVGGPDDRVVKYLGSDLRAGDEISIRVLEGPAPATPGADACDFCGQDVHHVRSLVAGPAVGICDACVLSFEGFVMVGASLPLGASVEQSGAHRCAFCANTPAEMSGLIVRNDAAICPECLRVCAEVIRDNPDP